MKPAEESRRDVGGAAPHGVVDHLFRHQSGRMVAALTRVFGPQHIGLAEDVVQDTLIEALRRWPFEGVPESPAAWLYQVARRKAIDVLRREQTFRRLAPAVAEALEIRASAASGAEATGEAGAGFFAGEIADDVLRMIFTCCHPALPLESQVALTLKVLGGFGTGEVAHALLVSEVAVERRLSRAKQRLQEAEVAFEVPAGAALVPRLDAVVAVLYLMFNEGYQASRGEAPIRRDVCLEAMRLAKLLTEHPRTDRPVVAALLALMCFHAARFDARLDGEGRLLLLRDQDRGRWDGALIAEGTRWLARSAEGDELTPLHLEAGIAALHCQAPSYEATDWPAILRLYDLLAARTPSPVVALNRAVAVAEVHGPRAGLAALQASDADGALADYHLLHATRGELHLRLGEVAEAATHLERALALAPSRAEQELIRAKLARTAGGPVSTPRAQP